MKEGDAVKKSLLISGFINGGAHFFFEDTSKTCYIPTDMTFSFQNVIDYMKAFSFHRFCNNEERLVYYRTQRKLEKLYEKFKSSKEL